MKSIHRDNSESEIACVGLSSECSRKDGVSCDWEIRGHTRKAFPQEARWCCVRENL